MQLCVGQSGSQRADHGQRVDAVLRAMQDMKRHFQMPGLIPLKIKLEGEIVAD